VFSSKLNRDSFIRNIYYIKCILRFLKIFIRKLINWEQKGNFN